MGKKRTMRAVFITLILTLLIVGAIVYVFGSKIIKEKDEKIQELSARISQTKAYAFSRDIRAGSVITPDDIALIEITNTSRTSGMYLENNKTWEDANGITHKYAKHYTLGEDGVESNIDAMLDEEIIGRTIKANVSTNTPVMDVLMYAKDEIPSKDERLEEFNYITLPSDLYIGDYCDIRLQFAGGEDFVVLVGKRVEAVAGDNTIFLKLNEDEIMLMASATIEAYINKGTNLYAIKYSDPSTQLFKEDIENYVAKYEYGVNKALLNKDKEKVVGFLNQSGDGIGVTLETLTDEQFEANKSKIIASTEADLKDGEIAGYAGIKEEHVKAIREAKAENDEDVINYYKYMRVQRRDEIQRTYAVRENVLKVIEVNPNLFETVKQWFRDKYNDSVAQGIIVDEYQQLLKEYETAPTYVGENSKARTKDDVKRDIDKLLEDRKASVEAGINKDVSEKKARRVAYLEELIGNN